MCHVNLPCQGNECELWPGSCLDPVVVVAHTTPCMSFKALIKSLAAVPTEVGSAVSGAQGCDYFHFFSHSCLARSWTDRYSVPEMAFAKKKKKEILTTTVREFKVKICFVKS